MIVWTTLPLSSNMTACLLFFKDCLEINELYPGCNYTTVSFLGNGLCDKTNLNNAVCGYDGGDCK